MSPRGKEGRGGRKRRAQVGERSAKRLRAGGEVSREEVLALLQGGVEQAREWARPHLRVLRKLREDAEVMRALVGASEVFVEAVEDEDDREDLRDVQQAEREKQQAHLEKQQAEQRAEREKEGRVTAERNLQAVIRGGELSVANFSTRVKENDGVCVITGRDATLEAAHIVPKRLRDERFQFFVTHLTQGIAVEVAARLWTSYTNGLTLIKKVHTLMDKFEWYLFPLEERENENGVAMVLARVVVMVPELRGEGLLADKHGELVWLVNRDALTVRALRWLAGVCEAYFGGAADLAFGETRAHRQRGVGEREGVPAMPAVSTGDGESDGERDGAGSGEGGEDDEDGDGDGNGNGSSGGGPQQGAQGAHRRVQGRGKKRALGRVCPSNLVLCGEVRKEKWMERWRRKAVVA